MYNTHDGYYFLPTGLNSSTTKSGYNNSLASFEGWLHGFLPNLTDSSFERLLQHYPANGTTETVAYNTTWDRASFIYRDVVLACPAYWLATTAHDAGYLGEFTFGPATHGNDNQFVRYESMLLDGR